MLAIWTSSFSSYLEFKLSPESTGGIVLDLSAFGRAGMHHRNFFLPECAIFCYFLNGCSLSAHILLLTSLFLFFLPNKISTQVHMKREWSREGSSPPDLARPGLPCDASLTRAAAIFSYLLLSVAPSVTAGGKSLEMEWWKGNGAGKCGGTGSIWVGFYWGFCLLFKQSCAFPDKLVWEQ